MASQLSSDSDEMITGINVTPLVDVVLVLLVIFMITAPVIYQATIKVDLPKAVSGENTKHITLKFTLTKSGKVLLGNDEVGKDKVSAIVQKALQEDPTANAVLAADKTLTHGDVIEFIDVLKSAGLQRFGIAVDSQSKR